MIFVCEVITKISALLTGPFANHFKMLKISYITNQSIIKTQSAEPFFLAEALLYDISTSS